MGFLKSILFRVHFMLFDLTISFSEQKRKVLIVDLYFTVQWNISMTRKTSIFFLTYLFVYFFIYFMCFKIWCDVCRSLFNKVRLVLYHLKIALWALNNINNQISWINFKLSYLLSNCDSFSVSLVASTWFCIYLNWLIVNHQRSLSPSSITLD